MYVPPGTPHLPVNRSDVMTVAVVARTDPQEQESVVTIALPPHLSDLDAFPVASPKLRPIRHGILGLNWDFAVVAGWRSGYFKVSGIGVPRSSKACRWVLVGSASIAMVTSVPAYRTWLRVKVARCSSRPRKLW